jgi:hypothetical protein
MQYIVLSHIARKKATKYAYNVLTEESHTKE